MLSFKETDTKYSQQLKDTRARMERMKSSHLVRMSKIEAKVKADIPGLK